MNKSKFCLHTLLLTSSINELLAQKQLTEKHHYEKPALLEPLNLDITPEYRVDEKSFNSAKKQLYGDLKRIVETLKKQPGDTAIQYYPGKENRLVKLSKRAIDLRYKSKTGNSGIFLIHYEPIGEPNFKPVLVIHDPKRGIYIDKGIDENFSNDLISFYPGPLREASMKSASITIKEECHALNIIRRADTYFSQVQLTQSYQLALKMGSIKPVNGYGLDKVYKLSFGNTTATFTDTLPHGIINNDDMMVTTYNHSNDIIVRKTDYGLNGPSSKDTCVYLRKGDTDQKISPDKKIFVKLESSISNYLTRK